MIPNMLSEYVKYLVKSRHPYVSAAGRVISFSEMGYRYSAFLYLLRHTLSMYPNEDIVMRNITIVGYVRGHEGECHITVKEVFYNAKCDSFKFFVTSERELEELRKMLMDFNVTFGREAVVVHE